MQDQGILSITYRWEVHCEDSARPAARHARPPGASDPDAWPTARLRHRAACEGHLPRRTPGRRKLTLSRIAASPARWLRQGGMGCVREQPPREILHTYRRGTTAPRRRAEGVRADCGCDPA